MKKLIISAALALAVFAVQADKTPIATLVVPSRATLMGAANKLGELSCNMMLAGFIQGSLHELPTETTAYTVLVDEQCDPSVEKKAADKPLEALPEGVITKLSVCPKATLAILEKNNEIAELSEEQKQLFREIESCVVYVRLNDLGLSVDGKVSFAKDSSLCSKYPTGKLPVDFLSFAGKNCLFAGAGAENGGADYSKFGQIVKILEERGLKFDFLTIDGDQGSACVTIDGAKIYSCISEQEKAFKSLDIKALEADLKKIENSSLSTPAGQCSVVLKGYQSEWTPSERFAATIPEAAGKPLCQVGVGSYYAALKAVVKAVFESLPAPKQNAQVKSFLETLPAERKGAIAFAIWMEGETAANIIYRISADEIRAFGMSISSVMAMMMSQQMGGIEDDSVDESNDDED